MEIARCGVFDCNTCNHLAKGRCPGCETGNSLLRSEGAELCTIYACVMAKGLESCKACTNAVCPYPHDIELACPMRAQFEKKRCYSKKLMDYYTSRQGVEASAPGDKKISDRTVIRLRWYLLALNDFIEQGTTRVSSQDIGRKVGVKPGLIRRDLSHFGEFGRPSIGYDAPFLRDRLQGILHLDNITTLVWIGPRRLAEDDTLIEKFADQKCHVAALFDTDAAWIGKTVAGLEVNSLAALPNKLKAIGARGAVIEVSPEKAQSVADALVLAGVKAILNLTSAILVTPLGIMVRNVDVAAELSALSYYCGENGQEAGK